MTAKIDRLVYRSRATRPTDALLTIAELLAEAQRNNHRDGLTGALAAHNGYFIQAIEGRPEALDGLQRRLAQDRRHTDMTVLGRMPVSGRLFDLWTMASARITPDLAPTLDTLMDGSEPSAERTVAILHKAVAQIHA